MTRAEALIRADAALDGIELMLAGRARAALAEGGATAAEVEAFMARYQEELAAWKRYRRSCLQAEIIEGAPARIHGFARLGC
jgi:hypothetical protein